MLKSSFNHILFFLSIVLILFLNGCAEDPFFVDNESIYFESEEFPVPTESLDPVEETVIETVNEITCADGHITEVYEMNFLEEERIDFTIVQGKDGTSSLIQIKPNETFGYDIKASYDIGEVQTIISGTPFKNGIEFIDVNLDGYADLQMSCGGTMNEVKELFIWDQESRCFEKVIFQGFDMLSFYEIKDGSLVNRVKGSAFSGVIQELSWEGNTLKLVDEEAYNLLEAEEGRGAVGNH